MLRFNYLINLGLAGVIVVPPALIAGGQASGLEKALADTISALDALAGVEHALEQGDYTAVDQAVKASETPVAGPEQQTAILDGLRRNVSELQMELDSLEQEGYEPPPLTIPDLDDLNKPKSTGLSDAERKALADILPPVPGGALPRRQTAEDGRKVFEPVMAPVV